MRDFIWTLIIIWAIYQLGSLFKNRKKTVNSRSVHSHSSNQNISKQNSKASLRKASDSEGEYVDFEDMK